ncbi:hypothetical protein [Curtobacterium pusillum]|uniref:hypothetical protein n=1 Tax=Curtobacterium pusillum TaxID=69373 RepID=UPI0011AAD6AF|nr:hypothetical protein [Curtobacterium pusillum]
MKTIIRAALAATAAAAVALTGLPAAPAAGATAESVKVGPSQGRFPLVFDMGGIKSINQNPASGWNVVRYHSWASVAAAEANADRYSVTYEGGGWYRFWNSSDYEKCLRMHGPYQSYPGSAAYYTFATSTTCTGDRALFRVNESGWLINKDGNRALATTLRIAGNDGVSSFSELVAYGSTTGSRLLGNISALNPSAAPGSKTTLTRGQSVFVPFGLRATSWYNSAFFEFALRAPDGATFDRTQTSIEGEWADDQGRFRQDNGLTITGVRVSADGKTLTGSFETRTGFQQFPEYQLRWSPKVIADGDAPVGSGSMGFTVTGKTSLGALRVTGSTPTLIQSPPIENGGLAGVDGGPVTLIREGSANVVAGVRFTGDTTTTSGSVTFTAPNGTTFPAALAGSFNGERRPAGGSWSGASAYARLTDGVISADGTKVTYRFSWRSDTAFGYDRGDELRWALPVTTPADARSGAGSMEGDFTGTTDLGRFTVTTSTKTTIPPAELAPVTVTTSTVSPGARNTITGTGEPSASFRVLNASGGEKVPGPHVVDAQGRWSFSVKVPAGALQYGFFIEQTKNGATTTSKRFVIPADTHTH